MTDDYTVRSEEGFAPTYDEDDGVLIRRGDLRALLDVATGSMDFGSGFLDNEQVEALRAVAVVLGVDVTAVTPANFRCQYARAHDWRVQAAGSLRCLFCPATADTPAQAAELDNVLAGRPHTHDWRWQQYPAVALPGAVQGAWQCVVCRVSAEGTTHRNPPPVRD